MLNLRILTAWPNYLIVPLMAVFWIIFAVLLSELFTAPHKGELS